MRTAAISLPGIEKADFHLARYYLLLQPGNGQLGVIGDDLLSQFTVQLTDNTAILSAETCRPEELIARGLTPVAQSGFFSSDPSKLGAGLPNVPVVFLRLGDVRVWAQIDTGYEDFVYSRSIDINQALFDRLIASGAKLDRVNDIDIWTCDGREHRPVYRIKDRPLRIENEQGRQIAETEHFHLIVKSPNSCGGIADMAEPAAQLGASFLGLFGEVIFDPRNATVWLGGGWEQSGRSLSRLRGDGHEPRADRLQKQLMRLGGDILHRGRVGEQRTRAAHDLRFGRNVRQVELAEHVHGANGCAWERRARRSAKPLFPSAAATAAAIRSG